MKLCKKCHWKNNDEVLFCAHCGHLMKSEEIVRKKLREQGMSPEYIDNIIKESRNRGK